jgi:hypothetical protein
VKGKTGADGCDVGRLKVEYQKASSSCSDIIPSFQSQVLFLRRRFGLSPVRAATIAELAFTATRARR